MTEEDWELEPGERWDHDLGDRVRMWSRSAREWKIGTIHAWLLMPYQRTEKPRYYEVIFDGTETPRCCRASALQRLVPASMSGNDGGDPPGGGTR